MKPTLFQPAKDPSGESPKQDVFVSSQDNKDSTSKTGTTVGGKYYSFIGRDEPIMCLISGSPIDHDNNYFGLRYLEGGDPIKSTKLFVEIKQVDSIYFTITMPQDSLLAHIIEPLQQKAQALGLLLEDKSGGTKYYTCEGTPSKVEQLFPILRDQLMRDRYCAYGKNYQFTGLYALFEKAYQKIQQNFENNIRQTKTFAT